MARETRKRGRRTKRDDAAFDIEDVASKLGEGVNGGKAVEALEVVALEGLLTFLLACCSGGVQKEG